MNGTHPVQDFWVCSNSGLVRRLGLIVFLRFGLLFLWSKRSEWSLLENFWVGSNFKFVQIFWIWLVVFAERAELTRKLLGLLEDWVCSDFLDLVCCFCGASEASGTHVETFGFVRMLGLFEVWVCSKFWIWFVVFADRAKRAEATQFLIFGLSGLFVYFGLLSSFGFGFSWPYLA